MSEIPPSSGSNLPPPPGGAYTPPPPPPGGGAPGASSDRTIMLVLSYLGILALIPLLTKKDDSEVQWHAKNGLALFVAWIALWIVFWGLSMALPSAVGCALSVIQCGLGIGFLVIIVMSIMKAVNGERFRIPVISDFADKM